MPNFRKPGQWDASPLDDASLAALLAGAEAPPDATAGLRPVADVLAALRARPTGGELAGEAAAMGEFRRRVGVSHHQSPSRRRRPFVLTSLLTARAAAAAAVAAVTLGGAAAAAFTGHLPATAQKFAHAVIGAPDVRSAAHSAEGPPAPKGHSAFGLCTAYENALKHGSPAQRSALRRRLVKAAGDASQVAAFCHAVQHPGESGSRPAHPSHPAHHSRPAHHPHPARSAPSHPDPDPSHRGEAASTP